MLRYACLAACLALGLAHASDSRLVETRCTTPDCSEPGCMSFPLDIGCQATSKGASALRLCNAGVVSFAVYNDTKCGGWATGGAGKPEWNVTLALDKCYQSPDATSLTLYSSGYCQRSRVPVPSGSPPPPTMAPVHTIPSA
jgi:hypothetical protein